MSNDMSNNGVVISESSTPLPAGVHLPIYMDNHATTPLDPRVLIHAVNAGALAVLAAVSLRPARAA